MTPFILTFVQLFIVVDAPGNIPFVITLTEGSPAKERIRVFHNCSNHRHCSRVNISIFRQVHFGRIRYFGWGLSVAGGVIILVLAIKYMTTGRMVHMVKEEMIALYQSVHRS